MSDIRLILRSEYAQLYIGCLLYLVFCAEMLLIAAETVMHKKEDEYDEFD